MIALQYSVGFCHISTWISHRFMYVSSLLNLLPSPIPSHPSTLSQNNSSQDKASLLQSASEIFKQFSSSKFWPITSQLHKLPLNLCASSLHCGKESTPIQRSWVNMKLTSHTSISRASPSLPVILRLEQVWLNYLVQFCSCYGGRGNLVPFTLSWLETKLFWAHIYVCLLRLRRNIL